MTGLVPESRVRRHTYVTTDSSGATLYSCIYAPWQTQEQHGVYHWQAEFSPPLTSKKKRFLDATLLSDSCSSPAHDARLSVLGDVLNVQEPFPSIEDEHPDRKLCKME